MKFIGRETKRMRVAILGYGTIGRGVYEIISQKATTYTSRMSVSYIWIRKGKEKVLPEMCDDFNKILADKEVEVVVEVLGGLEPARTMILEALRAKKHVVTANKKVVAAHLQEFLQVAKENEVQFLFEASTGGGIPWIRSVEKVKRIDEVSDFHGIFNGTTNYILDRMYKEGAEFDEVLKQAQQLGYAEHDPSADIDGIDIGNKLQITASLAYDCIAPSDFPIFGIRTITKLDIDFFKRKGKVVKLIGEAKRQEGVVSCCVEPVVFSKDSMEASVPDNFNLGSVTGTTIGELKFYGQGAGMLPTANAIVQDMIDIMEGEEETAFDFSKQVKFQYDKVKKDYMLRTVVGEAKVREVFGEHTKLPEVFEGMVYYPIKDISTGQLHEGVERLQKEDRSLFVARINQEG